jgi:ATPase family AAA domain-containing protein 3A/B
MQEELRAKAQLIKDSQVSMEQQLKTMQKEKRETERTKIVTIFNMLGHSVSTVFSDPKFLAKFTAISCTLFGSFYLSRLAVQGLGMTLLGRFGKP